ncbi:MAG: Rieske (2Fe-2S) protein [Terracoccus sp.]
MAAGNIGHSGDADRVRIGSVTDLADGQLHTVDASGTSVIVGAVDGAVCAASDRCPHLGLSLSKGPGGRHFANGTVTCPWHSSRFDLRTGDNLDWTPGFAGRQMPRWTRRLIAMGKTPSSLTTYPVTVEGDDVYVEMPTSSRS